MNPTTTSRTLGRREALASVGAMWAGSAIGQAVYPSKPLQLIIPTAPGGPVSKVGEIIGPALAKRLKQRVILQHIAGDGTVKGITAVARAPADGYTIGLATSAIAINAALRTTLPYSTLEDLVPISLLASFQYGIFVHQSVPVKTALELVSYARHTRVPVSYATPGTGTGPHIVMQAFAFEAGFRAIHRPYLSTVPAEEAVIAGDVPLLVKGLSTPIPIAQKGPLRLVALMGDEQAVPLRGLSWATDVVPNFEMLGHVGAIAPRAIASANLQRLGQELAAATQFPEVKSALADIGMEAIGFFSTQSEAHLRADIARWRLVGRVAGIKLQ